MKSPNSGRRTAISLALLGGLALFNLALFDLRPMWLEAARLEAERAALAAPAAVPDAGPSLAELRSERAQLAAQLSAAPAEAPPHNPAAALLEVAALADAHGLRTRASEHRADLVGAPYVQLAAAGVQFHQLRLEGGFFAWQAFLRGLSGLPCPVTVLNFTLERAADGRLDISCLLGF